MYGRTPNTLSDTSGNYGKLIVLEILDAKIMKKQHIGFLVTSKSKLRFSTLSRGFRKSTGFSYIYHILASQICKSVSIFGFSRERNHSHFFSDIEGGFLKVAPIDVIHSPKFETDVLEILGVQIF